MKRFRYLQHFISIRQLNATASTLQSHLCTGEIEFNKYFLSLSDDNVNAVSLEEDLTVFDAWCKTKKDNFPLLCGLACKILTLPCSEAFVERLFSSCGIFTAGRRNRMTKTWESAFFSNTLYH